MMFLRASLTAIFALACLCLSGPTYANGRAGPAIQTAEAPAWNRGAPMVAGRAVWAVGSSVVAEIANRYVGAAKFTGLPGAWCADAASAWLRAAGKPPLASRMASAALSYGPRGSGQPGDLAVFMGRRGAYHVGVVVAALGDRVEVVSGNWGHRVDRAFVSRRSLIFVRT
jgi:hypothetical protein